MIKLDENLLVELGLGSLPKPEKTAFLKHMYETLEMRVGTRLAERMSDQQMSEFEQFINGNDEQGAFHWLETNFPNYKDVVAEEFEKLKTEIRPLAAQIVSASQAQASQGQAGQDQAFGGQLAPQSPSDSAGQAFGPAPQQQSAAPQSAPAFGQPAAAAPTNNDFQSVAPVAPAAPSPYDGQSYGAGPAPQQQSAATPAYPPQPSFGQQPPVASPSANSFSDQSAASPAPTPAYTQPQPTPVEQPQSQPFNDPQTPPQSPYGQPQQPFAAQNPYGAAPAFGQPMPGQQQSQQPPTFGGGQDQTPPPAQPPSPFGPPPAMPPQ